MSGPGTGNPLSSMANPDRRGVVLEAALETFGRFGYRKTSMEDVAQAARISRPGLYFLFTSKESLFRAAVTQALERDLAAVESVLIDTDRPLRQRLLGSFDQWAGRYIGPLSRDVERVIEDNPDLLGALVETAPQRFEDLIIHAVAARSGPAAAIPLAQTMISTSIGIKHQVSTRATYLARLEVALDLLLR